MPRTPEKSGGAFRTIREVADWLGVPTHVLRFWESKFDQIAPVKGAGGRRYYRPDDMRALGGIKVMLHDQGLTIRAVAQRIEEEGLEPVMALSPELEVPDGPPARTRRVIRQGDAAKDEPAAAKPAEAPKTDDADATAAAVPIAKDPPSDLAELLPDQPVDPPLAPDDAPAPRPEPDLPEPPVPEPEEVPSVADAPAAPETPIPDAPADPPHQVRHAPDPSVEPAAATPSVDASPEPAAQPPGDRSAPLSRARALASAAMPVPPSERKRLRRLVRRYRALAEEIAEDLAEEAGR